VKTVLNEKPFATQRTTVRDGIISADDNALVPDDKQDDRITDLNIGHQTDDNNDSSITCKNKRDNSRITDSSSVAMSAFKKLLDCPLTKKMIIIP
jgi:hypothetical protein